ncbi:glucose 1-dehydrogenase [Bradyrhizobium sp. 83002]|uniref:SDR family NAD(P)-dependent oxidoreductase n=1 Tax=Bradyrhizobium aeschynomenes TaxID=2734909 RepID=UPI0015552372|nr:glucose 1-dehydrogenase [Bradyrhizobium aeschynomenes]NPU09693.1 glucose 1-dehydrogenase [Bradyrhizobium aeschynomenes]
MRNSTFEAGSSRGPGRLSNKVAVVTGGSKGIGAGIARRLALEGASVVVNYSTDQAGAQSVVADILAANGKAVAVQGNVAEAADIERIFVTAIRDFGRLDILVNNAGIYRFHAIEDITESEYRSHFDTNVLGLLLATQAAVARFGAEGGSIVNIGSIASRQPTASTTVYTATKASVDAITRTLSKELGPRKIRVNSINPGAVETEGTHAAKIIGSEMEKAFIAMTPLGRLGQPDDIAPVVAFLASEEARWITGETIVVSGGL